MKKYRKDTTVNVEKSVKGLMDDHIPAGYSRNHWLGEAIKEKIERETTKENPVLERNVNKEL